MRNHVVSRPKGNRFCFVLTIILIGIFCMPYGGHSLSIDTGFQYMRGDFGTDQRTTYIAAPLHITAHPFKYLVADVTIPYVYQQRIDIISIGGCTFSGSQGKGFGSGAPNPKGGGRGIGPSSQNQQGAQNDPSLGDEGQGKAGAAAFDPNRRHSSDENVRGIGDLYLVFSSDLRDLFDHFPRYVPAVDFSFGIKIPSANDEKGLGTGEYDYTLGLTLSWDQGRAEYSLYGDYILVGDTTYVDFENVTCFGCGVEFDWSPRTTLMTDLSGCTGLYPDSSSHFSLEAGIKRRLFDDFWFHLSGLAGLDEESSDYGFGFSIGMDLSSFL